jgi:hypothetical protein
LSKIDNKKRSGTSGLSRIGGDRFYVALDDWLNSRIDHLKKYQFHILSGKQYEIG